MCLVNEYRDEVSGRCLDLCGVNNTGRCLIDEECHQSSGACRNKCLGLCDRKFQYCDPFITHCEPCEDVCDPFFIDEYLNCKIHCPEQFKLLKGGHTSGVKSTTTGPSSTPLLSAPPSLATAILASAISVIFVIVITFIVVSVIFVWRQCSNNRGGKRNTREDEEQMLRKTQPGLPSTIGNGCNPLYTSHRSLASFPSYKSVNSFSLGPDETISFSGFAATQTMESPKDTHVDAKTFYDKQIRQIKSFDWGSVGNLDLREDGQLPPDETTGVAFQPKKCWNSLRSLASFSSYKSVNSFSLGPDETISFSGFAATQTVESSKDTHVDTKTFFDEQIRQIKSYKQEVCWELPPEETTGVVFRMPDLNLPTPTPSLQARIDEKIAIMEILDKMEFVEFHLFSRDKVTVVIKNNSISLVEARKQLLDARVPDRMFTVEYLK